MGIKGGTPNDTRWPGSPLQYSPPLSNFLEMQPSAARSRQAISPRSLAEVAIAENEEGRFRLAAFREELHALGRVDGHTQCLSALRLCGPCRPRAAGYR
jgi:hypothetical protein